MDFDLIVIGCGSAGTEAAKEALKHTKKVLCLEKTPEDIGGTCLNRGCVPTKFLREGTILAQKIEHSGFYGIESSLGGISLVGAIRSGKEGVIRPIRESLYKYLKGKGMKFHFSGGFTFLDRNRIRAADGKIFSGRYFLIATGSSPAAVKNIVPDGEFVLDTDSFWNLRETPKSVLIVGGGVSGLEFANILKTYRVEEVFVVEIAPSVLPSGIYPTDMVRRLERELKRKGVKILTSTSVERVNAETGEVLLSNGETLKVEKVLLTVGRKPNTERLGLESVGVERDAKGFVRVKKNYASTVENIFAVGDAIATPALAHVAKHEARLAVENIFKKTLKRLDYSKIPSVVYSAYEIGGFGPTEKDLKGEGIPYKTVMLSFRSVAKALAEMEEGLIKTYLSPEGKILGGAVLSKKHTDALLHLLLMAAEAGWTEEKLKRFVFAHPTVEEVLENI